MRKLFRKFILWVMKDTNENGPVEESSTVKVNPVYLKSYSRSVSNYETPVSRGSPINFNVYCANGGKVIEYSMVDSRGDRLSTMHVITDEQDLGERINQIITLELLKA